MDTSFIQKTLKIIAKKTANLNCHLINEERNFNDIKINISNDLISIPEENILVQSLIEFSNLDRTWIKHENEHFLISVISNITLGNDIIKFSIPNFYLAKLRVAQFDLVKFQESFN